jgi:hypothetical protein
MGKMLLSNNIHKKFKENEIDIHSVTKPLQHGLARPRFALFCHDSSIGAGGGTGVVV